MHHDLGMKPGERVALIKKIAASMAGMTPGDADLLLRQFSLQSGGWYAPDFTLDMFSGAISAIQDADDETLLGLHEYFFGDLAPSPHHGATGSVDRIWEADKLRLFVSHTSPNKVLVGSLKFGLAFRGVDAFVAHSDIEPTREWQDVIESALATCDAMLPWLTPDFPASKWTDQEVGFALSRSILVIPVRLGLDPYGFIGKYQALQGVGKTVDIIIDEVVHAIATSELTASRFILPAAQAFAGAGSYNMARSTFKVLTELPFDGWTDETLDTLERAAGENSQIASGIYDREPLPDLLRTFVAHRRKGSHV